MLPGGSEKVDFASRKCGVKDAMVAPIIRHITAKGKALRKASNNEEASLNAAESKTDSDGLDLMNINTSHFNTLVRQTLL